MKFAIATNYGSRTSRLVILAVAAMVLGSAGQAAANQIVLDAMANIHGAGHAVAPEPGGGGGGTLPPAISFTANPNTYFYFDVSGEVTPNKDFVPLHFADGGYDDNITDIDSYGGISGIHHSSKSMFMVGVFLTDAEPMDPAPGTLSFAVDENFTSLSPEIGQVFFIGDGLRDIDSAYQRFYAPAGATRLFLGFADAVAHVGLPGSFADNYGSLCVEYHIAPEPSSLCLAALGIVTAFVRIRRRK